MKKTKILIALAVFVGAFFYLFDPLTYNDPLPIDQRKAIIIGASSGIGKALAVELAKNGYVVGLMARRHSLLEELQKELPGKSYAKQIDIAQTEQARESLHSLITEMGGVNLIVVNSGIGIGIGSWKQRKEMIDVNVLGFAAMADAALEHFEKQGHGHLVGISSIAALRGGKNSFTYCATKAFDSILIEGIRNSVRSLKLPIFATDVKPGYVDTPMTKSTPNKFWEASSEVAAQQIYNAIKARKKEVYVTKRWRLVAWVIKYAPDWLYDCLGK